MMLLHCEPFHCSFVGCFAALMSLAKVHPSDNNLPGTSGEENEHRSISAALFCKKWNKWRTHGVSLPNRMRFTSASSASGRWDSKDFSSDSNSQEDIFAVSLLIGSGSALSPPLLCLPVSLVMQTSLVSTQEPLNVSNRSQSLTWELQPSVQLGADRGVSRKFVVGGRVGTTDDLLVVHPK